MADFPTNKPATVVNKTIDGVFSAAIKAVESALKAAVPILGWPVIGTIVNGVIEWVGNQIFVQFSTWVTFEIIDFQVGGEITDAKTALIALKAAQKAGDQNAIEQALQKFDLAVSKLTRLDGSA